MSSEEIAQQIRDFNRVCGGRVAWAWARWQGFKPEFVINALNGRV